MLSKLLVFVSSLVFLIHYLPAMEEGTPGQHLRNYALKNTQQIPKINVFFNDFFKEKHRRSAIKLSINSSQGCNFFSNSSDQRRIQDLLVSYPKQVRDKLYASAASTHDKRSKDSVGGEDLYDNDIVYIQIEEDKDDSNKTLHNEILEKEWDEKHTNIGVIKKQFPVFSREIKGTILPSFIINDNDGSSITFSNEESNRYKQLSSLLKFHATSQINPELLPHYTNGKLFYLLESAWYFNHEPLKNILIPLFCQKLENVLFKKSKNNDSKLKKVMRWAHKAEEMPERHLEFFNYAMKDDAFQNFIPLETRKLECHRGRINSVCFSPDATKLASASDDYQIILSDVMTGEMVTKLIGHTLRVKSISFSPDGTLLASVSPDYLNIWNTVTGECLHSTKYGVGRDYANLVCFFPCGMHIAAIGGFGTKPCKIFDITGKKIKNITFNNNTVTSYDKKIKTSPTKDQLAFCYDNTIYTHNNSLANKEENLHYNGVTIRDSNVITSMNYSPDGQRLVSGSCGKTVKIWNVESGECLQVLQEEDVVKAVCFSEDGEQVVFAVGNKVKIWDLQSGKSVLLNQDYSGKINTLSVSQNGTIAFGGEDNCVCLTTAASAWKELSFSQLLLLKYFIQHKQNGSLEKLASSKYCMKKFSKLPKIFRKSLYAMNPSGQMK